MPVYLELHESQQYIIYELSDPIDMNELHQAYDEEKVIRDSIPYTLHSIVDMSGIRAIPVNWLTAKRGPGLTHPRSGSMLFVGLSPALRMIIQAIMKITRYERMKVFETRAEADTYMGQLLAGERPTTKTRRDNELTK